MPCISDFPPVVPNGPFANLDLSFEYFRKAFAGFQDLSFEYFLKAFAEYHINQFVPFWPDLLVFKLINPLINLRIFKTMVVWQILVFPAVLRQINYETRRYFRRRTIANIFDAAPEDREALINHLWMQSQRKAYLDGSLGGWRSSWYKYLYHSEIIALKKLAEAKDKNRMLLYLGFVDASRFGSRNCEELHDHLRAVLHAWDVDEDNVERWGEKNRNIEFEEQEEYLGELTLIIEGAWFRRRWIEERKPTAGLWNQDPDSVVDLAWTLYGGDNLEFVEYGPSIRRLEELTECTDNRQWGGVHPKWEYAANWHYILSFVGYFAHKVLFAYLAIHGHYDITWDQSMEWIERTWPETAS